MVTLKENSEMSLEAQSIIQKRKGGKGSKKERLLDEQFKRMFETMKDLNEIYEEKFQVKLEEEIMPIKQKGSKSPK